MSTTKPLDSERGQPETQLCETICGNWNFTWQCVLPRGHEGDHQFPIEPPHRSEVAPERDDDVFYPGIVDQKTLSACLGTAEQVIRDPKPDRIARFRRTQAKLIAQIKAHPLSFDKWNTRDDIAHASAEDEIERLKHEREMLGRSIAEAAQKAGIYNGEVDLTGPDLIVLCSEMVCPNASAVEVITAQRDEWQKQGWTTHVFAANELLELLGS